MEEDATGGIDVAADVGRAGVPGLLGSEVIRRTEDRSFAGEIQIGRIARRLVEQFPTEADIDEFERGCERRIELARLRGRNDHQVRRLNVAVDHPVRVQVIEAVEKLFDEPASLRRG